MKKNIQILSVMVLIIVGFSFTGVRASSSNINTTLYLTTVKNAGSYINEREYPALYTSSAQYDDVEFAILDADGNYNQYYSAPVGTTMNVTKPASIKGPNSVIQLRLKNKSFHASNNYSGILFH